MRAVAMLTFALFLVGCGDTDEQAAAPEPTDSPDEATEENELADDMTEDPWDDETPPPDDADDSDDGDGRSAERDEPAEDADAEADDPEKREKPEQVYPSDGDERQERRAPEDPEPGRVTGTLGGSAELEGGCVWIDTGSGRYEVEWPEGYTAETDPVTLLRGDEVVAEDGDRLTVSGSVQDDAMTICQVGPLFRATSVEVRS